MNKLPLFENFEEDSIEAYYDAAKDSDKIKDLSPLDGGFSFSDDDYDSVQIYRDSETGIITINQDGEMDDISLSGFKTYVS